MTVDLEMQTVHDQAGRHGQTAWSATAARDRLSSTTFLAALFHGILILGITFSAPALKQEDMGSSMDVVLVTSEQSDRIAPENAVLLAQQNLAGAGNAAADAVVRTSPGQSLPSDQLGPVQEGGETSIQRGAFQPFRDAAPVLLSQDSVRQVPDVGDPERTPQARQTMLPADSSSADILARFDTQTAIPDAQPRELLISANTRESRIASYLGIWKRKVEAVGTRHFPFETRDFGNDRSPVLEVAINADGGLREVVLRTSSGQRDLDQAAMNILRMAAPFEPFPEALRKDYDVLRFAYEWRFSDGSSRVGARTAASW
jgi:protein TonB